MRNASNEEPKPLFLFVMLPNAFVMLCSEEKLCLDWIGFGLDWIGLDIAQEYE